MSNENSCIRVYASRDAALVARATVGGAVIDLATLKSKELATRCGFCDRAVYPEDAALGKEAGLRRSATDKDAVPVSTAADVDKVLVYYLHTTFRCATCNRIEKLARQVVAQEFTEESADGRVEWRRANFQERNDLAKRYGVASSTVVVVDIENGEEKDFKRLDEVWTLHDRPKAFSEYVSEAIRKAMQ